MPNQGVTFHPLLPRLHQAIPRGSGAGVLAERRVCQMCEDHPLVVLLATEWLVVHQSPHLNSPVEHSSSSVSNENLHLCDPVRKQTIYEKIDLGE